MAMKIIFFIAVAFVAPFASAISHQQLWDEANILGDTINNTAMILLMGRYNQTHVLECFAEQAENFDRFGLAMKIMLYNSANKLRNCIGDLAANLMEDIGDDIRNLTDIFWPTMQSGNHEKAFEIRDEIGEKVNSEAESWADQVKCRQIGYPDVVEKAYKTVKNIHDEARRRSREMSTAIGKCVREGPKNTSTTYQQQYTEFFTDK